MVERRQYSEHPPRFEYHLTESGQEARPILLALAQWGERWALDNTVPTFTHACGHPLDAQISCRHCGEPVTGDSLRVRPEQGR
ncbi:winged helix-turn-helix transcriptional regulator [Streptacidiphilus sp. PAMC 29251]